MKKFRVRPIEIEAEQYYFVGNPNPHPAVKQKLIAVNGVPTMRNILETSIGAIPVHEGDWLLKYPDGSLHVMDPEGFEENYEPV